MSLLAKKFRQATFRGVPFQIDTTEYEVGRRTSDREYPKRDTPNSEDLGRKAREFSFDAYVLGEEYESARDALLSACEKFGPGDLVHPYLGNSKVVCKSCRVRERRGEIGFAQFSLTFREAGQLLFPETAPDALSGMETAAAEVSAAAASNFEAVFTLASAPGYILDAAEDKLEAISDTVESVARNIRSRTQSIADLSYRIRNFKGDIRSLLTTPAQLAAQFQDVIGQLAASLGADPTDVRLAYQALFLVGADFTAIAETTPSRSLQAQSDDGMKNLVRRSAVAGAASQASQESFESLEDANAAKTVLLDQIDELMEGATGVHDTNDEVFSSLQKLRIQVLQSVPPEAETLPQLVSFTPADTIPSLVISYDLYETSDQNDALVARNKIRHPGFVTGNRAIQVLRGGA